MQRLVDQAAGLYAVAIARIDGPRPPEPVVAIIHQWAYDVAASTTEAVCLACDARLYPSKERAPAGWLILLPARPDVETVSVSPICPTCAAKHDDEALTAIVATWFEGRVISADRLSSTAGRA